MGRSRSTDVTVQLLDFTPTVTCFSISYEGASLTVFYSGACGCDLVGRGLSLLEVISTSAKSPAQENHSMQIHCT
jgi:hypothetical protein